MDIFTLLITLIIWALIFWIIWWGVNAIGVPEPFYKVIKVVLIVATIIVLVGLLTGHISPFPVLR